MTHDRLVRWEATIFDPDAGEFVASGWSDAGFATGLAWVQERNARSYQVSLYDAPTGRLLGIEGVDPQGDRLVERVERLWSEQGRTSLDGEMRVWLRRWSVDRVPAPGRLCPLDLPIVLRFATRAVWRWYRHDPARWLGALARALHASPNLDPWARWHDEDLARHALRRGLGLTVHGPAEGAEWPPSDATVCSVEGALDWLWQPLSGAPQWVPEPKG